MPKRRGGSSIARIRVKNLAAAKRSLAPSGYVISQRRTTKRRTTTKHRRTSNKRTKKRRTQSQKSIINKILRLR